MGEVTRELPLAQQNLMGNSDAKNESFSQAHIEERTRGGPVLKQNLMGINIPSGLFDGCKYLYIDMGCNVGTKLRQFWEAELYTGPRKDRRTPTGELFDTFFPKAPVRRAHASEMCAIGFEANVHHEKRLRKVEACFTSKGWRLHVFAPVAVADHPYGITMCSDDKPEFQEWGFSAFTPQGAPKRTHCTDVPTVNVTHFMQTVLASGIEHVIVKMDVEGMEWRILPPLIFAGFLCRESGVEALTLEFHENRDTKGKQHSDAVIQALKFQKCTSSYYPQDDESYLWDKFWGKTRETQGKFGRPIRLPCEPVDTGAPLNQYGDPKGGLNYWETFDARSGSQ